MDHVAVGEVQCLNTADREVLTSVGETDSRNSVRPGGNRDARAGTVGLTVEEHRIAAAARAADRIAAMGPDMDLLVVAAGHQRATANSGVERAAGIEYVAAARAVEILLGPVAALESNVVEVSSSEQDIAATTTAPQLSTRTASNQQLICAAPGYEHIAAAAAADQSGKVAGVI